MLDKNQISLVPEYDVSSDDDDGVTSDQNQNPIPLVPEYEFSSDDDGGSSDQDQQDVDGDDGNDSDVSEQNEQMHPVRQFSEILNITLPEGPIQLALPDVEPEPLELPIDYEWVTVDLNSPDMCLQVCNLLTVHYANQRRSGGFKYIHGSDFLNWALRPPGYYQSWHIGVRDKASQQLIAFISGVPQRIRVGHVVYNMAKVSLLCIVKMLRSNRLAPVMIMELKRRINLENIWQAAYFADDVLPTPFTTCRYWARIFNPERLTHDEIRTVADFMEEYYQLPDAPERNDVPDGLNPEADAPVTPGFRQMEIRDVPAVTRLLRNYLSQFAVAIDFDEIDVEHWLLPREDVVDSYLVQVPETKEITDFCSFYQVPLLISGWGDILMCAYSLYNVATKTPFLQLMNDALLISKQRGFDMFCASDVMENEKFFEELQFAKGYEEMYYYLYNYRMTLALKPSEVGLVLF